MAQVKAAIVLSQATVSPPGGYSSGGRDDLIVSQEITATNLDNGSVTSHKWELFVPVGQTTGGYSLAGTGAASLTCTPPTYGDCTLKLTVRGDPLPDGSPNIATAEVVLGIRCRSAALLAVYPDGVPIPHQREGTADRGTVVVNAAMGREGRVAEAIFAVILLALAGGGGLMPSGTGTVRVDGGIASAPDYVKVGANPAGAGALRTANASIAVAARNAANSGDLTLLSSDASDTAILGAVAKPTKINGSSITLSALALAPGYGAPSGSPFSFSSATVAVTDGADTTLSSTQYNCHDLNCTGALTANRNVIVPLTAGGTWRVINATTGGFAVVVKGATGTGVTVTAGTTAIVRSNGTNVVLIGSAGGGGGSTPTGTGFRHVTAGVEDAAAALVTNADVDAAAAIAVTKLALGAANTVLSSDGATNTFSATPTVTGLTTTSHLTVGGAIKMDGGFSAITAGSNVLTLGSQTHFTGVAGSMPAAGTYTWAWGGTTYLTFSQSAAALSIAPASAAVSVTIQQADNTTNSATGAPTVIAAQTATGTNATGGALSLIAGYATLTGGAAMLRGGDAGTTGGDAIVAAGTGATNGTIKLSWGSSPIITYSKASTVLTALATASTTSITHGFVDLGTNGATGGVMAVRGQTCTGTTSIGGDLRVGPGGGTSRPGQMYLAFGATDLVTFTFNSSAYQWTVDSSALSVAMSQTGAAGAGTGAMWSIFAQSRTSGTGGEMRIGGGTGSGSSTHGAVTIYVGGSEVSRWDTNGYLNAKLYTGLSGNPFAYGVLNKTQTGGTTTLSSSEYCFHDIVISGTLASAGIIEFPATAGGSWTITNSCAGSFSLAVRCTGGSRLIFIGRNQTITVRADGGNLWAINDKPAIGTLAEGIIDYTGAISTNTDTTIYTVQSQATTLITGIELYLEPAQVGAGSSVTMTVGDTAGGTQWILSQTITTATTLGTVYGLDTTHLGSNFDATKGYVFYGNRASKSIVVRCARGAGGAVTAGSLRWRVLGAVTG